MNTRRNIVRLQKRMTRSRDGAHHPIYQITVPVAIVRKLGVRKGDRFEFFYSQPDDIIARKVRK